MALKGLDIFKLTPKTNCKECGFPTCMAFSMKVAQGAVDISKCPHLSEDALMQLSEATAPPMKAIKVGTGECEHTLGGETVMYRHEKTYVNRNIFAVNVTLGDFDQKWSAIKALDYDRIGEREYVEALNLVYEGVADDYALLAQKAKETGRLIILDCDDPEAVGKALEVCADTNPVVNGATEANVDALLALVKDKNIALGVKAPTIEALHDLAESIEGKGYKELLLDVSTSSIRDAFGEAIQIRRASLMKTDRTFGYPSIVDVSKLAPGDQKMQEALAALFIMRYGSIIILDQMTYADALPLYGLRQNIYTDPQKPMTVEPGVYPINGADNDSMVVTTVDFALTYFVVSGELERSGVPVNLMITDAGGYSVLTAWAAGKLSAGSIAKYIEENDIAGKYTNHTLVIPGKVAVLKGALEEKLPDWTIVVAPNEATDLVKFLKDMNG